MVRRLGSCVLLQKFERDDFQRPLVRRGQHDWRGYVLLEQLEPPTRADAPAIAGLEPRKIEVGTRGREIVSHQPAMVEKFLRDFHAHGVAADVLVARVAVTVAKKAGARRVRTWFQGTAENIARRVGRHGGKS